MTFSGSSAAEPADEERVYTLSTALKAFLAFVVLVLALVAGSFAWEALTGGLQAGALAFIVAWLAFIAVSGYFQLRRVVYKVVTRPDGHVTFHTALRRLETDTQRVERVWTEWWDFNRFQVKVRFDGTTVWIPSALDSLFALVTYLRVHNPNLRIDRL